MYFLFIFILYYSSTLSPSVNTYVVLSANLNDFRSLAKKYVPNKNSVDQIEVMVLETDHKNKNRENFKEDELERTIEYVGEEQDDSYEVSKPVYKQQEKSPRISLLEPQDPSPVKSITAQTAITVDDLVNELKQRILQEVTDKGGVNTQVNDAPAKELETVVYRTVKNKPKSLNKKIKNTVPLNVFKEEVKLGDTYQDAIEEEVEPQIQYLGQIQIPAQYFKGKPVKDKKITKKVVANKHRFRSPKTFKPAKKVRYVQQMLVPSKLKQSQTEYVLHSSLLDQIMQQPSLSQKSSLGQHTSLSQNQQNILKPSMLEAPFSLMQQSSELKIPLDQQPSIVQHLALMKQQIDRLNKIVEQNYAKPSPTSEAPPENVDTVEAPFEIVLNENSKEDDQKATDSAEDQIMDAEDSLSEEITTDPVVTETSSTTVENEQFIERSEEVEESTGHKEEHTPRPVEDDAHETAPEAATEETVTYTATTAAEDILVKGDIIPKLNETPKIHTQEFGSLAAGAPIVEKTYNFNAPVAETKALVNLKLPVGSARKVLLF